MCVGSSNIYIIFRYYTFLTIAVRTSRGQGTRMRKKESKETVEIDRGGCAQALTRTMKMLGEPEAVTQHGTSSELTPIEEGEGIEYESLNNEVNVEEPVEIKVHSYVGMGKIRPLMHVVGCLNKVGLIQFLVDTGVAANVLHYATLRRMGGSLEKEK